MVQNTKSQKKSSGLDKLTPYTRPGEESIPEFPMVAEFDVAVIGGGPNGLISAAYLARSGLSVIVLEKRIEVGGGLATEEVLFPCYYSNTHAIYHMMVDYMPLLKDFDLARHGVSFYTPNLQTAAVFEDGTSLTLCKRLDNTRDSLVTLSPRDGDRFLKVMSQWRQLVEDILGPATYLPPMGIMDTIGKMQRTAVGRELLEVGERTPLDVITDLFENKKIQATLLYCICHWGLDPRAAGMGYLIPLLLDRVGMNKAYCNGGSHRMAAALAREIMEAGGMIMSPAPVSKILVSNGQVKGVAMPDGREIHAKVVLSSLDPQLTFSRLVGEEHLDGEFKKAVNGWQLEKKSLFSLRAVLHEPPRYKAADPWVNDAFMTVMGFENVDDLLKYWDGVVAGDIADNMVGYSTCETLLDPDLARVPPRVITPATLDTSKLAPRAQHIAFFQMHAPYDLKGGWEARTDEIAQKAMARWRHFAPNLTPDKIEMTHIETPLDIERRLASMRRGSIKHGDYSPFQMGVFRPNTQCSDSRTPISGLYTCGASNYPGGLVLGACGYLAANAVVKDLGIKPWWGPTSAMRRYEKLYLSD